MTPLSHPSPARGRWPSTRAHAPRSATPATITGVTPPPPAGPRFLRLADVADELATTTSQVYALVRSGELRAIQIGGRNQWRVERVMLEEYIEQAYRRTADSLSSLPADVPGES